MAEYALFLFVVGFAAAADVLVYNSEASWSPRNTNQAPTVTNLTSYTGKSSLFKRSSCHNTGALQPPPPSAGDPPASTTFDGTAPPIISVLVLKPSEGPPPLLLSPPRPTPENPDPENPIQKIHRYQFPFLFQDRTRIQKSQDPQNPDPENPDSEETDQESTYPKTLGPEEPDPENPDPEEPDNPDPKPSPPPPKVPEKICDGPSEADSCIAYYTAATVLPQGTLTTTCSTTVCSPYRSCNATATTTSSISTRDPAVCRSVKRGYINVLNFPLDPDEKLLAVGSHNEDQIKAFSPSFAYEPIQTEPTTMQAVVAPPPPTAEGPPSLPTLKSAQPPALSERPTTTYH
ncbi:hypothetical protein K469DRAFT_684976 [Zopfia rhizophila CBS 207.26]|uniref:Uncharacterized protein n=1 Tax=Zopfia rhizophila CBS 207.26 TaxID=1314779 RepID=A0A6A6ECH4_9PEZI|nr:hypothetical protein K469DRAFT_684976 [Zopfia rhizophila CBS 207.26]